MTSHAELFETHRSLLFSIAYEMLGSVMDAEDVVQDAFVRWKDQELARIRAPKSYLAKIVTRLSLDRLRDEQREREEYPGPWLPEPLHEEAVTDPVVRERAITTAFLRLLETLTPMQRAVFLLREVFGAEYGEIAEAVDTSQEACRKHVSRAHKRLRTGDARYDVGIEEAEAIAEEFVACCRGQDQDQLMSLLSEDFVSWSDGGGEFHGAARRPVHGKENVARLMLGAAARAADAEGAFTRLNGYPAIILRDEERAWGTISLRVRGGLIREIFIVVNPKKLEHLNR